MGPAHHLAAKFLESRAELTVDEQSRWYRDVAAVDESARIFKGILSHIAEDEEFAYLEDSVQQALANNLVLDRSRYGPGESETRYERYFLCAELADDDMPWDAS